MQMSPLPVATVTDLWPMFIANHFEMMRGRGGGRRRGGQGITAVGLLRSRDSASNAVQTPVIKLENDGWAMPAHPGGRITKSHPSTREEEEEEEKNTNQTK